jgi:multidrug efflux system membrane fusion protein
MKNTKRWLFFIPVICGVLLVMIMVKNKKVPNRPEISEPGRQVGVLQVQPMTIIPRVIGYGYVEPTERWEAISEVSGKVVAMHPELKKGAFISKGEVLLQIDPESYGLAETRGKATVMTVEAQIKELQQQKVNTERQLAVEREALTLTKRELERKRQLHKKGFVSQSELEQEEKSLLAQETALNSLINTLDLIPSKEKALLAQRDSNVSSLSELQLDLQRTEIAAPFDCRIAEVNVELDQFSAAGSVLVKAINISEVEIPVKLSPSQFVNLLSLPKGGAEIMTDGINMDEIRQMVGISAEVRLPMFHKEATWEATFMRTSESVDLETGALTVYVAVQRPYEKINPGVRPPLLPNLYCEVELKGQKRDGQIVLPMRAVHSGRVYLVDEEKRLKTQAVTVEMVMGDFAVISEGLSPDNVVVLTDLVPAIEGMLLEPILDERVTERLRAFGPAL